MGELIDLDQRRAARLPSARDVPAAFCFDLGDPHSYLTAEVIERTLGEVTWVPVGACALRGGPVATSVDRLHEQAEERARSLRLPLVWPERFPSDTPRARRAAARASELGVGGVFALAAARLAFCGGFDLEDPETLAEAAAAAGVALSDCLSAAGDQSRDAAIAMTAAGLRSRGVTELPAIRVHGRWFAGGRALAGAAAALVPAGICDRPLAPVC